jgi:hypothetical protein
MKASAINHQQAIGHDASQYLASALATLLNIMQCL